MIAIDHDVLKSFIRATEEFEGRFTAVLVGKIGPQSETGETYHEYINGKRRQNLTESFPSGDEAIRVTFERLNAAFPEVSGRTLYWRIKPEIAYAKGGYRTYCRFLVSDKTPEEING